MSASPFPIIVTRAEPGAAATVAQLEHLGLTVLLAPMLNLELLPQTHLPNAESLAGLVFTSANGVRTYADRRQDRSLTAWCVGPATAEAARLAGFSEIRESAGNAVDLAHYVAKHTAPLDRPLLHVANEAATGTLKQTLTTLGFDVLFAPLYVMRPVNALTASVQNVLADSKPAIVLVHSAKGAAAFAKLIDSATLKHWHLVAISEPAGAPLAMLAPDTTHIADAPNEDGLMRALDIALATLSA